LSQGHQKKESGIDVTLKDARLRLPSWDKKKSGFTCTIKSGKINAIMGQSGCGKTSLLYAIQGRKDIQRKGLISLAHRHPLETFLSDKVGYVPQEDVMHSDLTVFETVYFSARARRLTDEPRLIENDVKFVLAKLDMSEKYEKITETLSGGEKKRVNIAIEIAACPKLLLLDEPTSGLDSVICDKLFDLLSIIKQNAFCPVNIIMIIHQPSFELFQKIDHVIFLTPQCFLAYQGDRKQALAHVHKSIREMSLNESDKLQVYKSLNECDKCIYALRFHPNNEHHSEHHNDTSNNPEINIVEPPLIKLSINRRSIFKPIFFLIHRTLVQMCMRNYATESIYGFAFFILGLTIGKLFKNQTQLCDIKTLPSIYFLISFGFGMAACISSLRLFGIEMADKTFIRESRNYYHPFQYWLAKTIVDLIHLFSYPLLFLTMLYIEIEPRSTFGQYYGILLVTAFACTGIGQFVSVACQRTENSYLAATLIALISCLISGFNPTKREKLNSLVFFSFSRHIQRQLFIYDMDRYIQTSTTSNYGSVWSTQVEYLREYYSFNDVENSVGWLLGIGIISRLLTIIFLYGRSEYRSKLRFYFSKLFIGYQAR
ncbi:unnamed protein product, partial [Didymodactylos carnosus]